MNKRFFTFLSLCFLSIIYLFAKPELVVQDWHDGGPSVIEYSSDGRFLMTAGSNDIKVWDVESGMLLKTFSQSAAHCERAHFYQGSKYLLIPFEEKSPCLYEIASGNLKPLDSIKSSIFALSADENYLASYVVSLGKRSLEIYGGSSFNKLKSLDLVAYVSNLVFSRNSKVLAAISSDTGKRILAWYLNDDYRQESIVFERKIRTFDLSPDGRFLIVSFWDKNSEIIVYDLLEKKQITSFASFGTYSGKVLFSQDGNLIFDMGSDGFAIRTFPDCKIQESVNDYMKDSAAFSPDGKTLAILFYKKIQMFDVASGKLKGEITSTPDYYKVQYDPSRDYIWILKSDGGVILLNSALEKQDLPEALQDIPKKDPFCISGGLYYQRFDNETKHWLLFRYDVKEQQAMGIVGFDFPMNSFTSTKDGKLIAFKANIDGYDRFVLYDVTVEKGLLYIEDATGCSNYFLSPNGKYLSYRNAEDNNALFIFEGKVSITNLGESTGTMESCPFSYDDKYFAALSSSKVLIADMDSVQEKFSDEGYNAVCFSYDSRFACIDKYREPWIYDLQANKYVRRLKSSSTIENMFFSKDGKKIFIHDYGNRLCCYSTESGDLLATWFCDKDRNFITYTPDGTYSVSGKNAEKFVHYVDGTKLVANADVSKQTATKQTVTKQTATKQTSSNQSQTNVSLLKNPLPSNVRVAMDSRVRRVPNEIQEKVFLEPKETLPQLVAVLTSGLTDTRAKVKVIHDWICDNIAYDTEVFDHPEISYKQYYYDVLQKKAGICSGYANLFNAMCFYAKIESEFVQGWSKGWGYPGYLKENPDHAWNVVKLGNTNLLVDCTWDAGYVDYKTFVKHYSTEWFLKPGIQFIYSHLPVKEEDQFLPKNQIRSPELFVAEPYVTGRFWDWGFSFTKEQPLYTNEVTDSLYAKDGSLKKEAGYSFALNLSNAKILVRADVNATDGAAILQSAWADRNAGLVRIACDVPDSQKYKLYVSARIDGETILPDHLGVYHFENNIIPALEALLAEEKIKAEEYDLFKASYYKVEENGYYYLKEDLFDIKRNATVNKLLKEGDFNTKLFLDVLHVELKAADDYKGYGAVGNRFPKKYDNSHSLKNTRLVEPRTGILQKGKTYTFRIQSGDYSTFAFWENDQPVKFKRNSKSGFYELEYTVPSDVTLLNLYASGDAKSYQGLWAYNLAD